MKSVFVASSRKYYDKIKEIKTKLDDLGIKGHYPYFDFHNGSVENNEEIKKKLTLNHFPEIDEIDILYVYAKDGYVGYSVIVNAVNKWTNLTKNQEALIYPGESSIHWILKLHRNFKDMEKPLVQKVMAFTILLK